MSDITNSLLTGSLTRVNAGFTVGIPKLRFLNSHDARF